MATLLSLPAELRQRVWRHHFRGLIVCYEYRTTYERINFSDTDSIVRLFLVSRQVYREAEPAFYQEVLIDISNLFNAAYSTWSCPVTDPTRIQNARMKWDDWDAPDVSRILHRLTNMRSLTYTSTDTAYSFQLNVREPRHDLFGQEEIGQILKSPLKMILGEAYGETPAVKKRLVEY